MRDGQWAAVDIIVPDVTGADGDMVHFCPNPLFFIQPLPLPTHTPKGRNGEEDYREDRGSAARCQLFFIGVLPSKNPDGGVTPRAERIVDILLIWPTVGFRQSVCASGAYGSSAPSSVRYSHLGCRW